MEPKFQLETDLAGQLLRVTTSGHWSVADVKAYEQAQLAALARFHRPVSELKILIDTRGQTAQSQDVIATLQQMLAGPRHRAKRTAVLASSALLALQIHRTEPSHRHFTDENLALAWLDEA